MRPSTRKVQLQRMLIGGSVRCASVAPRVGWSVRRLLAATGGVRTQGHRRVGRQALGILIAMATAVAACGGATSTTPTSTSTLSTSVSGPILALVTAASVDADGQPSGLSQAFAPSQPKVTALVLLGGLEGATDLAVTWSQMTGNSLQPLFTQHIAVRDFDRAFSTALSQGVLASGTYQVSASIDGATTTTAWLVTPAFTNAALSSSLSAPRSATPLAAAAARKANLDAFSEEAGSTGPQPPTLGPSGVIPPPSHLLNCGFSVMPSMDNPDTVSLVTSAACPTPGPVVTYRGSVFATMQGPLHLLGPLEFSSKQAGVAAFHVDVCSLPGGSDLPGAVFTWRVVYKKPSPFHDGDYTGHFTLPADYAAPVLTAGSTPPHGTKVQAGERIKVHITATEPTSLGPQEGIHDIQLLGPDGPITSAVFGNRPTACDKSRLTKTLTTDYTVPDNPPPIIHLIAIAHDFVNDGSASLSADFPTGDVWTGTAHVVVQIRNPHLCPATSVQNYSFKLAVGAKGAVQGTETWVYKETTTCGPGVSGRFSLPMSGQLTAGEFHLKPLVDGYSIETTVPLSLSKTTAAGPLHVSNYDAGDGYTLSWNGSISLRLS